MTNKEVMEGIALGLHPTPPEGCPAMLKSLMLSCWKRFPKERNSFSNIVAELSQNNSSQLFGYSNSFYGKLNHIGTKNTESIDYLAIYPDENPFTCPTTTKQKATENDDSGPDLPNNFVITPQLHYVPTNIELKESKSTSSIEPKSEDATALKDEPEEYTNYI